MSAAEKVAPIPGLVYEVVVAIDEHEDYTEEGGRRLTENIEEATVATSRAVGDENLHKIVIDLDLPAALVPSSTEGHFHLYVDHAIPWERYVDLLLALAAAGLVEEGYVGASLARGHTAARLPWVRKGKSGEAAQ